MKLDKFINGTGLLNLVLFFGVWFFSQTYYKIFFIISPANDFLSIASNIMISTFFGLLIFIVIRKVENIAIKVIFSLLEFCAVLVFYLQFDKPFIIVFIAFLASIGVFTLASISTNIAKAKREEEEELLNTKNLLTQSNLQVTNFENELLSKGNELLKYENELQTAQAELLKYESELLNAKDELLSTKNELLSKEPLPHLLEAEKSKNSALQAELARVGEEYAEYKEIALKKIEADAKRGLRKQERII